MKLKYSLFFFLFLLPLQTTPMYLLRGAYEYATGTGINAQDADGNTQLHRAFIQLRPIIAELVYELKEEDKNDAKIEALKDQIKPIIQEIKTLLKNEDIKLNVQNKDGNTILHTALSIKNIPVSLSKTAETNIIGLIDNSIIPMMIDQKVSLDTKNRLGNTPLNVAIMYGNTFAIKLLLNKDFGPNRASIDIPNNAGNIPIHLMIEKNYYDLAYLILDIDPRLVNSKNNVGDTPLHIAVEKEHVTAVSELLSEKYSAMPGLKNNDGETPLHKAIEKQNIAMITTLLKYTRVDIDDNLGNTPLHKAIATGNKDIIDMILAKKPIINRTNIDGNTPLHFAAQQKNPEIVQLLLRAGAQANAKNNQGQKPLNFAMGNPPVKKILEPYTFSPKELNPQQKIRYGITTNDTKLMQQGIAQGGNVNKPDEQGNTALHDATQLGREDAVDELLKNGAQPGMQNNNGETSLHLAVNNNNALFDSMLKKTNPKDLKKQDKKGNTALHKAAKSKQPKKVKALLDKDISKETTTIKNNKGKTAKETAKNKGINKLFVKKRKELGVKGLLAAAKILRGRKGTMKNVIIEAKKGTAKEKKDSSDLKELLAAAKAGDVEKVKTVLAKKTVTPTTQTKTGSTPLHEAIAAGKEKIVELFIQEKADLQTTNKQKQTAFDAALFANNTAIAQQLLTALNKQKKLAAVLQKRTRTNRTILHLIATKQNASLAQTVINFGASVFAQDANGQTPLHAAALANGSNQLITTLLGINNANINLPDNTGNTPLHLAVQKRATNSAIALLANNATVNVQNNEGVTPLMQAVIAGDSQLFALLLDQKAALHIQDNTGKTMLDYLAASQAQAEITAQLTQKGKPTDPALSKFLNPYYIKALSKNKTPEAQKLLQDAQNNSQLPVGKRSEVADAIRRQALKTR